ncbi:acyltransferase family protein [Chryseobacterium chendengshani]|uniref:acyltransferase family protein n=1 Tax=Chryseobacterium sp. LJ668 TaxID=2864040 RepID=UPI001C69181A|nr:acyltransferase family protein [Chryseobacterium sp. LJ668]MBW8523376.1 acyltransferase family protein [Chryseobacterium sp. LJ668]QYK15665.1 acyltransferase family protein [Chryseobacterium sp. LJ668]
MGRNLTIDLLKIVLAFFVVFLHMNFLRDSQPFLSYLLVNGLFRIAVPVFLVITGFYFLHINSLQKLKKWLFRTFLLYAIWMAIYITHWKDNGQILLTVIFGYHHLWYLIGTFFSGIILYLLRRKSSKLLITLAVFLFFLGYVVQVLGNLHYFEREQDFVLNMYLMYRNFLFVCFPFLTIGFLINRHDFDLSRYKNSYLLVILSVSCVVAEAFFNYSNISSESADVLFSLLFACPLVFLYFQKIYIKTTSKILANLSTAIYVVHPLIMKSDFYADIKTFKLLMFLSVLIPLSFALVYVNKKLKYLL